MARKINPLTTRCCSTIGKAQSGRTTGQGLPPSLSAATYQSCPTAVPAGFSYVARGKLTEIGLGSARVVTLASARMPAAQARGAAPLH
jgi:hypothetical protein